VVEESLGAELERLYELDELKTLSAGLLGLDPEELGGGAAKGSFARALARRCLELDAVQALLDVVRASRRMLSSELVKKLSNGAIDDDALPSEGQDFGELMILRELGRSATGAVYRGRLGGEDLRVRVVSPRVQRRGDAQRYFTAMRLAERVHNPGLATGVVAGRIGSEGKLVGLTHQYVEGKMLAELIRERGGRHLNELLPLLWAVVESLTALHAAGLCHGALHAHNLLVVEDSSPRLKVVLQDVGAQHLRTSLFRLGKESPAHWLSTAPPELFRGDELDARSDVYSLGALVYELMSGRAPFVGESAMDVALGHLSGVPEPLSFVAAGNGASPQVENFVRLLLEKEPARRPKDAAEAMESLERLWRASTRPSAAIADEVIEQRFDELIENPSEEESAAELESLVDLGVEPLKLADGFFRVAREVRTRNAPGSERAVRKLVVRAARLYEGGERHEMAEQLYQGLIRLDARDVAAVDALNRLRRKLGKYEELVESLLERTESAENAQERAACYAEIGQIYSGELDDKEQALVAYAQAFCEDPSNDRYADQVERIAGSRYQAWEEVLVHCLDAMKGELANDAKAELAYRMGRWYAEKVGRSDLGLPWLNRVLELEPAHDRALTALSDLYRKAQQWSEMIQVLVRRADVAPPNVARDLRVEAAEILARRLSNPTTARELLETVVEEDPAHPAAVEALVELQRKDNDPVRALKTLERRADALSGEERHALLSQIGEAYEVELDRLSDAERFYRTIIKESPDHLDALRGLDRILTRTSRYAELAQIIRRELDLALTARQKVGLYERLAAVYDREFLDHDTAAELYETVIKLDPERTQSANELVRLYRVLERWENLATLLDAQRELGNDDARKVELGMLLGKLLSDHLHDSARAMRAYERVLELAPNHAPALDALATLRAAAGDARSALDALDALAERAPTPAAKAEHYLRSAQLLEARGDVAGALMRYKFASDATPGDPTVSRRVREKYIELGNYAAAVELLEEELGNAEGAHQRAKLAGQIALLSHRRLLDDRRAHAAATLALELDPTNPEALCVEGRLAYADERYTEAAKRLENFMSQSAALDPEEAAETSFVYIDSLAKSGAVDRALSAMDGLMDVLAADANALLRLSEVSFEHGSPERTLAVIDLLLERHQPLLGPAELALALYRRGEALLKLGRIREAMEALERSVKTDPKNPLPLRAQARIYTMREEWEKVVATRYRELDLVSGDARIQALMEIGDVAANKVNNPDYAARAMLLALDERPNDRNILAKLMQLYSSEKDWPELLEVISRLAEVVDDDRQRAKYLLTGSKVAARELRDPVRAVQFVDQALKADPDNEAAFEEALTLRRQIRDYDAVKELLKTRAQRLGARRSDRPEDRRELLETLSQLADVYEDKLGRPEQAIRVCESALALEPDNQRFEEKLARLYVAEPSVYFDQALKALGNWIARDPYRPQPYKMLRKVYTEARRADGAFLACQALHVLGQTAPDEERFFDRMKSDEPPEIRFGLTRDDWFELIAPEDSQPMLTALFAMIEPYVIASRAQSIDAYGLDEAHRIDPLSYPYGLIGAVHLAADALGIPEPVMYQKPADPGVLGALPTQPPVMLVGGGAFGAKLGAFETSFVAAHHLAYYQPGMYLRKLLPNLTALKTWLFAAIRLVKPRFPLTPEIEAPVAEAGRTLMLLTQGANIENLTHFVTKLLSSDTALDLKRWVQAVDHSADRAGLAVCHDLQTACTLVQSLAPPNGGPSVELRMENLFAYSVSPQYLELRMRQGVAVDQ
jgi:tetratricopeptide (TPR) repeat protein